MKLDLQRTIVAVSSGLAAARRAIVRISGAETGAILLELVDERSCSGGRYRLASATSAVCHAVSIDIGWRVALPALVYYWPDARSFTGEPCAELHILGALPLVEALVERIVALGATPAQRGEFTLRSFLAGKLDLTQAEAVLAVIEADSKSQLELALQQLAGNLSVPVRELRSQLVELIARLEAGLDFVEEDIEFISTEQLRGGLQAIAEQLEMISARLLSRGTRGRNARIVLVGRPNAGKSSLFNALVGKERVIVSPQAGTTRDAVAQAVLLGNLNVELIDTAGIEALHDFSPRSMAQATLEARLRQADMAIFCIDLSASPSDEWVRQQTNRLRQLVPNVLLVGTKADLVDAREITAASLAKPIEQRWTATVSPFVPGSIESFRDDLLAALAESRHALQTDAMHETAIRCRGSLELARAAILRALGLVAEFAGEELVAAELRLALEELSAVIGEVHTEDILGEIFGRFCIGK